MRFNLDLFTGPNIEKILPKLTTQRSDANYVVDVSLSAKYLHTHKNLIIELESSSGIRSMEVTDIREASVPGQAAKKFWSEKGLPLKVQKLYINFCSYQDVIHLLVLIRPTDEL